MVKVASLLTWVRKNLSNLIFALILLLVLYRQLPIWMKSFQATDQAASAVEVTDLASGETLSLPQNSEAQAIVFWATWCPPCQIELDRIHEMVQDGQLRPEQVVAISSGEEQSTVRDHVAKKGWRFQVALDPDGAAAKAYHVQATPTTVLVSSDGMIQWYGTGISPLLTWRLKRHF